MAKHSKRISQTAGLPPGTLVHIGAHAGSIPRITVLEYDEDHYEEKETASISESCARLDKAGVTWINVDGVDQPQVIEDLNTLFGIHPLVQEDIMNTGQRPKVEDHGDYFFIVLKMIYLKPQTQEIISEQVSLVLGANYVLSFQEREGDVFDPIRDRIRQNKGRVRKCGADYLAYALFDGIVDNYFVILETYGDRIEELEEKLLQDPQPGLAKGIHNLKRNMIFLRKQVWPLREVVNALHKNESKLIHKATGIYLRDVYDHTIQVIDTVESFRDMLTGLHDVYLSSISNRMNEIMKVLTIFAAIFIPLTFLAGIYGMNFEYMPELKMRGAYFVVLGVMAAVAGGLLLYFKKKKWI